MPDTQHCFCKKQQTCYKCISNVMSGIRSHLASCQYGGEMGSYSEKQHRTLEKKACSHCMRLPADLIRSVDISRVGVEIDNPFSGKGSYKQKTRATWIHGREQKFTLTIPILKLMWGLWTLNKYSNKIFGKLHSNKLPPYMDFCQRHTPHANLSLYLQW